MVGIDQSASPCQRISLPPACASAPRSGSVASQNGASFSTSSKKTAVNFSSVTADAPRSFSKAKYCSHEVMNEAGVTVPPAVRGRLALVPFDQLNSLASEQPPGEQS